MFYTCLSVHAGRRGVVPYLPSGPQPLGPLTSSPRKRPPGTTHPSPGTTSPRNHKSGWYASYWNAFMFSCIWIKLMAKSRNQLVFSFTNLTGNIPDWRCRNGMSSWQRKSMGTITRQYIALISNSETCVHELLTCFNNQLPLKCCNTIEQGNCSTLHFPKLNLSCLQREILPVGTTVYVSATNTSPLGLRDLILSGFKS